MDTGERMICTTCKAARVHFPVAQTPALPFTLPATLGHGEQRRLQAVRVVADVTVVTQQQARRVGRLPTRLAHDALQAPPALPQHRLGDLGGQTALYNVLCLSVCLSVCLCM